MWRDSTQQLRLVSGGLLGSTEGVCSLRYSRCDPPRLSTNVGKAYRVFFVSGTSTRIGNWTWFGSVLILLVSTAVCSFADRDSNLEHRLKVALQARNVAQAVKLVKAGAPPDTFDTDGTTALMLVSEYGTLKDVKAVVQAGGNLNQRDKKGRTAIYRAVNRMAIASFLFSKGADLSIPDLRGKTPIEVHKDALSGRDKSRDIERDYPTPIRPITS